MVNTKFVFPYQLHEMLEDAEQNGFEHVVSWLPGSQTQFKVHDIKKFEASVMGKYFQTMTRYKSFLRQLNIYGFIRKQQQGGSGGYYTHPLMIRHNVSLCSQMVRTKIKKKSCGVSRRPFSKATETKSKMEMLTMSNTVGEPLSSLVNDYNVIPMNNTSSSSLSNSSSSSSSSDILPATTTQSLKSQIEMLLKQLEGSHTATTMAKQTQNGVTPLSQMLQQQVQPILIESLQEDEDDVVLAAIDTPCNYISCDMANDIIAILGD